MSDREIERAIKEGKLTKCPPGEALGAKDIQNWSQRIAAGKSGVYTGKKRFKKKKSPWSVRKKSSKRSKKLKGKQSRRAHREREETGRTERRDFSDMNVYDMSIPPWEEQTVIESTAERRVSDIMRHG